VALAPGSNRALAETALHRFGEPVPDAEEYVSIRLAGGAARVAEASRALEKATVAIEGLELHNPTLDDVFHEATGRRLEGSDQESAVEANGPPPA
jgi:ABC-2 type transport system ATP-binding protein